MNASSASARYAAFGLTLLLSCTQSPDGSPTQAAAPSDAASSTPSVAALPPPAAPVVGADTSRAIVEPSASQVVDQMIDQYGAYAAEYGALMQQSKLDEATAAHADSLLLHADNTYAGLVDAMETIPFTAQQRQRLEATRQQLGKLR